MVCMKVWTDSSSKGESEEQILAIKLLIDIAHKTNSNLYITFIDYHKPYDKVNVWKLLRYLDLNGCGTAFLQALVASIKPSLGTIWRESFRASAGVHQGATTSILKLPTVYFRQWNYY